MTWHRGHPLRNVESLTEKITTHLQETQHPCSRQAHQHLKKYSCPSKG